MRRDPTEFRKRFAAYKDGKLPYSAGRINDEVVYKDIMKDVARENYQTWGYDSPEDAWQDQVNNPTYNYREYYTDPEFYMRNSGNANDHWPDKYKTPQHNTFSNESIYSGKQSKENPYGLRGGIWIGDKFIPAAWQQKQFPKFRIGGTIGMPAMPAIAEQNSEAVHNTLSYIPFIGTGMDIRDALNGDRDAIVPAMIGVAADTFGFNSIRNAIRATNAFKSAVKNKLPSVDAYRLMKEANNKVRTALGGVATYASDIYSNTLQMFQNKKKNIQTMKSE